MQDYQILANRLDELEAQIARLVIEHAELKAGIIERCTLCKEWKPSSAFYPNHRTPSGLFSRCKKCEKAVQQTYYQTTKGKAAHQRRAKRYRLKHPQRARARVLIGKMVAGGEIQKPEDLPCVVCGEPAQEYHHHNGYSSEHETNVVAVCIPCHISLEPRAGLRPQSE